MVIKPELIVSLWLVPVFLFMVLPVLFLPLILLGKKKLLAGTVSARGMGVLARRKGDDDKRELPRLKIEGIIAQVSDGVRCCRGSITDFSQSGIRLISPKGGVNQDAESLGVLLTGSGESFHMRVKPLWKEDCGPDLRIGASIEETLGNWGPFVEQGNTGQYANAA